MEHTPSPWTDAGPIPVTHALAGDARADVCIVGAGIAGLSTAYECVRAGLKVIVLDDGPIGGGETSRTTAHLSNAFDDRYHNIERVLGADAARLVAASHTKAIDEIERIVQAERIDCGFERVDGYLFSPDREGQEELEQEIGAALRAGLPDVSWVERAPFPSFDTGRCLRWPRQALAPLYRRHFDMMRVGAPPPEESTEFAALLGERGVAPIFLLAPTTPESRIAAVAKLARGYVYYVSLKGVTGASHLDTAEVSRKLAEIRRHVRLPIGVGFGIRDAASARAIAADADAVVIGSRIIQEIESGPADGAADRAGAWLAGIRSALDSMRERAA